VINTDDNAALEFAAPRAMYQRDDFGLALGLYEAGTSPFDRILRWSADDDADVRLRDRTRLLMGAREAYSMGMSLAIVGETVESMRILVQSYRDDPANTHLYRVLQKAQQGIRQRGIPPRMAAELEPVLREVDTLVPPPMQQEPLRSPEEVCDVLRRLARAQVAAGRMDWAAEYLSTAREYSPQDPDLVIELAASLVQAGRVDGARDVLSASLEDGILSEERLAAEIALRGLVPPR
jgi:hypothetical protein